MVTNQIGRKKILLLKVKNTVPWKYVTEDLNGEKIIGKFYEKVFKKKNQTI